MTTGGLPPYLGVTMKHIAVLACVLPLLALAGCVSARNDDGTVSLRFSRLADEAEVAAVAKRVDGVESALVVERTERTEADVAIRADVKAADDVASLAFQDAISQGKTASEAMGAATAAAAAKAQAQADAATAKAIAAAADAAAAKQARDEIDSGIIGKLGIEEILAMLGITGAGGAWVNSRRNKTRADALAKVEAVKTHPVPTPPAPAS